LSFVFAKQEDVVGVALLALNARDLERRLDEPRNGSGKQVFGPL
jgi:hypothetical protein